MTFLLKYLIPANNSGKMIQIPFIETKQKPFFLYLSVWLHQTQHLKNSFQPADSVQILLGKIKRCNPATKTVCQVFSFGFYSSLSRRMKTRLASILFFQFQHHLNGPLCWEESNETTKSGRSSCACCRRTGIQHLFRNLFVFCW